MVKNKGLSYLTALFEIKSTVLDLCTSKFSKLHAHYITDSKGALEALGPNGSLEVLEWLSKVRTECPNRRRRGAFSGALDFLKQT